MNAKPLFFYMDLFFVNGQNIVGATIDKQNG